jgi:hypothetical protein
MDLYLYSPHKPSCTFTSHVHARFPSGPIAHTLLKLTLISHRTSRASGTNACFVSDRSRVVLRHKTEQFHDFLLPHSFQFIIHKSHTTRRYPVSSTDEHYVVGYAKCTGTSK